MKRIITYGNYDLLHYGHINFLQRARQQGDYLIVSLAEDEYNLKHSKKRCYFNYLERKLLLESIRYVDLVIPQSYGNDKIEDIKLYRIDMCIMGNDWEGKFDFLKDHCDVLYLPRTLSNMREISTTKIKRDLNIENKIE
ncbi:adenylyltransferase/cytidyltransferase family protein [Parabacteroides goldsteinii]|uniref:adenylyltransferase/cytidyltransferase family protein n=1 Tax=Parabacteroides goldsteinii TaxID=328812 RepID=UPI001D62EAA3|nr:adenylyltransferase/cytidyltransferase family protein [Parabacteroides goldsteinii]MBS6574740.1 adenylyltransferase/cytidyltransferase family protein [Parabacteroides goldsteinii]